VKSNRKTVVRAGRQRKTRVRVRLAKKAGRAIRRVRRDGASPAAPVIVDSRPKRYTSQLLSDARRYFRTGVWTVETLVGKRRRMAVRLLAIEQVLTEAGAGVLSVETRQALRALSVE